MQSGSVLSNYITMMCWLNGGDVYVSESVRDI